MRKQKYNSVRTHYAGRSFMSKGEAACFGYLELLEKAGEISDLKTQVTVRLTAAQITFVMDFSYFDHQKGELVYADFKGFEAARWGILKKLWPFYGPGPLVVYKMSASKRITITEEISVFSKVQTQLDLKA